MLNSMKTVILVLILCFYSADLWANVNPSCPDVAQTEASIVLSFLVPSTCVECLESGKPGDCIASCLPTSSKSEEAERYELDFAAIANP